MNKGDVTYKIAEETGMSKADASRCLDVFIDTVTNCLKKGEPVQLVGFGTFDVRKRGARTGRNPQTGATINIKASKNVGFKAGKALKDAVN